MTWGDAKHQGGFPVQRRDERCDVKDPDRAGHLCVHQRGHDGVHECVCHKSWGEAVPA